VGECWWDEDDSVFSAAQARSHGTEGPMLRRAVVAGGLTRIRRDAYVGTRAWAGLDPGERYRLLVATAARTLHDPVFSHRSAAVVWGLPLLGDWPTTVQVTAARAAGGRSQPGVARRCVGGEVPRTTVEGLVVTTLARTVVDLARTESFASGLMAADAALGRRPPVDAGRRRLGESRRLVEVDLVGELAAELAAAGCGRGTRAARRVLAHASGLAESAGESLSRARMIELGAPVPELQHSFTPRGRLVRVDFWWPERRLVGEFDGRLKYRLDGLDDSRSPADRLWAEKQREDDLRALGLRVVRWTWADAVSRRRFADVLTRAHLIP